MFSKWNSPSWLVVQPARVFGQCAGSKGGGENKPNGWELVSLYDKPVGTKLLVCITVPLPGATPGQRWQLVEAINDTGNRCNWAAAAFRTTSLLEVERVAFVVEPLTN